MGTLVADTPQEDDQVFESSKLPKVARFAASGFAALTSILTFLGIRDELLTKLLAQDVTAALWAFLLIGAGAVLALFALAIRPKVYVFIWWLSLGIALAGLVTGLLLKNEKDHPLVTLFLFWGSIAAGAIFTWIAMKKRWKIALAAGLLVAATAATSMGLYAAAKLSADAKIAPQSLIVDAGLVGTGRRQVLHIELSGNRQKDGTIVVVGDAPISSGALGRPNPDSATPPTELWRSYFSVDSNNEVAETYDVSIAASQWSKLTVLACIEKGCEPRPKTSFVTTAITKPPFDGGTLALGPGGKKLWATAHAARLLNAQYLRLWLSNSQGAGTRLSVELLPSPNGTIHWKLRLPASMGIKWRLQAAICLTDANPCSRESAKTLALYRVPKD